MKGSRQNQREKDEEVVGGDRQGDRRRKDLCPLGRQRAKAGALRRMAAGLTPHYAPAWPPSPFVCPALMNPLRCSCRFGVKQLLLICGKYSASPRRTLFSHNFGATGRERRGDWDCRDYTGALFCDTHKSSGLNRKSERETRGVGLKGVIIWRCAVTGGHRETQREKAEETNRREILLFLFCFCYWRQMQWS